MAKRCMIAVSAGQRSMPCDKSQGWQHAVDVMKGFWQREADVLLRDRPDLIVMPEASDRYHCLQGQERIDYYRTRGNQMLEFWSEIARNNHTYVAYSAAREMPDGTWRNSTQLLDREGKVCGIYNKNHLVIAENTVYGILNGKEAKAIQTDFGKVGCVICFDLNFEPVRKKYEAQQPQLLLFSSMYQGGLMQGYWAYACRSYFVGAICGEECTVVSPVGETIARTTEYTHRLAKEVNLDFKLVHWDHHWDKLSALKAKYGRGVTIYDPGKLGAILVTNEMEGVTIDELLAEFEIEPLDGYFDRSLKHQLEHQEP